MVVRGGVRDRVRTGVRFRFGGRVRVRVSRKGRGFVVPRVRVRVRVRVRAIESDPFWTFFAPKRPKNPVRGSLSSGRMTLFLADARPSGVTFRPWNDPRTTPHLLE